MKEIIPNMAGRKRNAWLTPMSLEDLKDAKHSDLRHRFLRGCRFPLIRILRRGQFSGNVSPNIGDFGISLKLFCASARPEPS
jgi:hypothetical protein